MKLENYQKEDVLSIRRRIIFQAETIGTK